MRGIPLIHAIESGVGLMQRDHGSLGQCVELGIGDDGRDLYHYILVRIQAGHLHIDPNEVAVVLHRLFALDSKKDGQCNKLPRQTKPVTQ